MLTTRATVIMRQRAVLQRGGILLLVLLMLLILMIISAASVRFIVRQAHQTVLQEQEEQAFAIADAGVNYTVWLLAATGGNFTPQQLVASPPPSTKNHPVTDATGETIGKFDIFFGPACTDSLEFRSVGYDAGQPTLCQVVNGKVQQFTSGEFKLITWDHLLGYPCTQGYQPPPPACPSPTP